MTCSVLVATYNRPTVLKLCLESLFSQTHLPDQIIVCDDGSGPETQQLIAQLRVECPVQLIHVWQPDEGFKLAQIRNKGIALATSDYILQIDGDVLLHPKFVKDQLRMAKPGIFYSGNQFHLDETQTHQLLTDSKAKVSQVVRQTKLTWHRIRVPFLQKPIARLYYWKHHYRFVLGCNMAFWRNDLIAVNGYDEGFVGWGWEDTDLAFRLMNLGRHLRFIRFGAIQYHLYHPPFSRSHQESNRQRALASRAAGLTRCQLGIANHFPI